MKQTEICIYMYVCLCVCVYGGRLKKNKKNKSLEDRIDIFR